MSVRRAIRKVKKIVKTINKRKRKAAQRSNIQTQYRKRFAKELVRQDEPITFKRLARQAIHGRISAGKVQQGRKLRSSFIELLEYDEVSRDATVYMKNGSSYRYGNVPRRVFMAWEKGRATCKTDDTRKWIKKWWIGKTPSLGAFYNQKIKGKYSMVILT